MAKKNFKPANKKPKDLVSTKKDEVGKAADNYIELRESKSKIVEEIKKAEETLIKALEKANRKSITVGGYIISINFVEAKIKIKVEDV